MHQPIVVDFLLGSMDSTVIAAIITAFATIVAGLIAWAARRKSDESNRESNVSRPTSADLNRDDSYYRRSSASSSGSTRQPEIIKPPNTRTGRTSVDNAIDKPPKPAIITPSSTERISLLRSLEHGGDVRSIAFSPDGRLLASGGDNNEVRLWRVDDGALQSVLSGHTKKVVSVVFLPSGRLLATGSSDGTVRWWRLPDGAFLTQWNHPGFGLLSLAVSPDGRFLASSDNSKVAAGFMRVHQVEDGTLVHHSQNRRQIPDVAFSPDGHLFASVEHMGTISLWRVQDWARVGGIDSAMLDAKIAVLKAAFASEEFRLAFSPDGQALACGGDDKAVRLWRVDDRVLLRTLEHGSKVRSIAFSPDGRLLASGSEDRMVRLWGLA